MIMAENITPAGGTLTDPNGGESFALIDSTARAVFGRRKWSSLRPISERSTSGAV